MTVYFLGTGAGFSDLHRTTTMLAFRTEGSVIVVDCGGDVVQRLQQARVPLEEIAAVIITHEHPDHVAGFPLMMQKLWLGGRRAALPVHGIGPALAQARKCFAAFDTTGWEGLPEIQWREFPHQPGAVVIDAAPWRVTAMPALHGVPNVALRVEQVPHGPVCGAVCVYSSDTGPSGEIARFAHGAHLLIHEATGAYPGHSTAADAAQIAAAAGVGALRLAHLPPAAVLGIEQMEAAREIFPFTSKAEELEAMEI
jgi:ribonuclease Z